jgi:glycosyltransferase involved in cell wall biosynthesis
MLVSCRASCPFGKSGSVVLRVLVVDHTAREGGAELALVRLAEALDSRAVELRALLFEAGPLVARLRDAGVAPAVVALDPDTNHAARDRLLAPSSLARSALSYCAFVPRLVRAIRRSGCDLVVANSLKSAVFMAVASPLAGRRWVWHLHDRLSPDYLPPIVARLMGVLAVVGPRCIVVNSEATLDTLPLRARRKARIAYPGLSPSAFEQTVSPARTTVGIVGRISPTKGQREFLDAAAEVAARYPEVEFRIVGAALFGETSYERELLDRCDALGLRGRVTFTGWVQDPEREIRRLTLVVHASPVAEPFGQVVAEAMAAGVPVIATDAGGVREMLLDGQPPVDRSVQITPLGVLVRPADVAALAEAIEVVLSDLDAARARAELSRDVAARLFRIESTVGVVMAAWQNAARTS